jgi:peroxiredoxin
VKYNISALPTTFIIDRNGDIVARVDDPNKLEAKVAAQF